MQLKCTFSCKPLSFIQQFVSERTKDISGEILLKMDTSMTDPQEYWIARQENLIEISCCGDAGAMYGAIDVADIIRNKGLQSVIPTVKRPYIQNRGIKFNIPLDVRTPSYSDTGDSAQRNIRNMWDFSFWKEFLDQMAENKYNCLSLWNLHPFPSMVLVPEYPEVALDDIMCSSFQVMGTLSGAQSVTKNVQDHLVTVKKMTIAEKIGFWQKVMEYADQRCIRIYIFTWNVFTYGTEYSGLPIDSSMDNEVTKDYFEKSVVAMIRTYPLLAGIGITAGEEMKRTTEDESWLSQTYGKGIKAAVSEDPERKFTLIHRAHFTSAEEILDAFEDRNYALDFSFKYSQAHMYANTNPSFGDSFFQQIRDKLPQMKTWLTVRNDDYYMFRWADPSFAREYLQKMPHDVLAGFYMGPDGYTWGIEYLTRDARLQNRLVTQKMWMMMAIWGQLSYDADLPDEWFERLFTSRFGDYKAVWNGWVAASKIIPLFQCTHWHDLDFQWYPESCCSYNGQDRVLYFRDVNEFIHCPAAPGSGYMSVEEYGNAVLKKKNLTGISPVTVISQLRSWADMAVSGLPQKVDDAELEATIQDIRAMSVLGQYYADKLEAAVNLFFARICSDEQKRKQAVDLLEKAYALWKDYSAMVANRYYPQMLTRYRHIADLERLAYYAQLDIEIARYQ